MEAITLLKKYLEECHTMQLATVNGEQPWVCTVRFLADEQHNLYWASIPSRRHSQELEKHPQVGCAIVVHNVIGEPVIGIQIEGTAARQEPSENNRVLAERYAAKFKRDAQWVEDFIAGHTEHQLYKLTLSSIYLFDEQNFPGGQRQKLR